MKIAIASDHAGFELKKQVSDWLKQQNHQTLDYGTFTSESVDYPDYAFPASEAVSERIADFGILICGSGTGMAITANKVNGIRAAASYNTEIARLARSHNNANVLCLGARMINFEIAKDIITIFLGTEFEAGRHTLRVEKIQLLTGR